MNIFDEIKSIMDKSKCYDIFQKTKIYQYHMYPRIPMFELIKFNKASKDKTKVLEKLQIVKNIAKDAFNGYGNLTYINITLEEIKLTKELFVLSIEKQEEVFIPQRLSLQKESLSYQFYDPIFLIIE